MNRRTFLRNSVAAAAATVSALRVGTASSFAAAPTNHSVNIVDFAFSPEVLSVRQGDRVTWTNLDIVPHTATAEDGSWDTGEIEPNGRFEMEIVAGMSERYFCRFHPAMSAAFRVS